jgi:hypothetical protein
VLEERRLSADEKRPYSVLEKMRLSLDKRSCCFVHEKKVAYSKIDSNALFL